jgi:integrase
MLAAEELRRMIDGAMMPGDDAGPELVRASAAMRAMILLGINAGMGNGDCASLTFDRLDMSRGWLDYPRPKTGVARRCPLWPETVAALRDAIGQRPEPEREEDANIVLLTSRGYRGRRFPCYLPTTSPT